MALTFRKIQWTAIQRKQFKVILFSRRQIELLIGVSLMLSVQCLQIHATPFDWPPSGGNPTLTLLGPVYEAELERKKPLFKALEGAVQPIREDPGRWLPDFYNKNIGEVRHLLFRMGYRHDEEWGAIKNVAREDGDFDNERIASILSLPQKEKQVLNLPSESFQLQINPLKKRVWRAIGSSNSMTVKARLNGSLSKYGKGAGSSKIFFGKFWFGY